MSKLEVEEVDFEDWEEWDENKLSFTDHMLAGSIAGLAEHICMFPVDTIKTNMQCEKCGSTSPFQTLTCAQRIIRSEGIFRLWRGVTAMFIGCIPAHAAYFSIYESLKKIFELDKSGHYPVKAAICGATAAFFHDLILTPWDVVKQRLQLGYHRNSFDCVYQIVRTEGVRALYRSFPTTLAMNIPYGCIMMAVNESVKKVLNPNGGFNFQAALIAGGVAGSVAAIATTPLDVIKTRLQTQGLRNAKSFTKTATTSTLDLTSSFRPSIRYYSMVHAYSRIVQEEGYQAFLRGMIPRMLVQAPSVAVSWAAYEVAKSTLSKFKVLSPDQ